MNEQFSYRATKDGRVLISWEGRVVTTLKGAPAQQFLARTSSADADGCQLEMARVTKNFKRGDER